MDCLSSVAWNSALIILGIVRGLGPSMYRAAGGEGLSYALLVTLRSPFIAMLYLGFMLKDICTVGVIGDRHRLAIKASLKRPSAWMKVAVMGFLEGTAASLLFALSLSTGVITPKVGSLIITVSPLVTEVFARFPIFWRRDENKVKCKPTPLVPVQVVGIVIGLIGFFMALAGDGYIYAMDPRPFPYFNYTVDANITGSCQPLQAQFHGLSSGVKSGVGVAAAIGAVIFFALATAYWQRNRSNIHYAVAGCGQYMFSSIFSFIFFIGMSCGDARYIFIEGADPHFSTALWVAIVYVVFIGGVLGTLLTFALYQKFGPTRLIYTLYMIPIAGWVSNYVQIYLIENQPGTNIGSIWAFILEVVGTLIVLIAVFLSIGGAHELCQPRTSLYRDDSESPKDQPRPAKHRDADRFSIPETPSLVTNELPKEVASVHVTMTDPSAPPSDEEEEPLLTRKR